ncbi:MAG: hypothetical protein Q8O59_04385 [bacterium]|nr:hypothetical protein [bacterium]
MADGISMAEGTSKIRVIAGDHKCPDCGTKVIGGDHSATECQRIKGLVEARERDGGIIVWA